MLNAQIKTKDEEIFTMKQLVMYHQQQATECWKQLEPEQPLSIKELPALLQSRLEKHTAEVSELTAKVAVTQQQ